MIIIFFWHDTGCSVNCSINCWDDIFHVISISLQHKLLTTYYTKHQGNKCKFQLRKTSMYLPQGYTKSSYTVFVYNLDIKKKFSLMMRYKYKNTVKLISLQIPVLYDFWELQMRSIKGLTLCC